jgi:Flp pilus assembly protein TadD/predicted aspartyl protease
MTRFRLAAVLVIIAGISLAIHADGTSQSQSAEIELQLGNLLFSEGRYQESLDAFTQAVRVALPDQMRRARTGFVQSALRVAEFDSARQEAERLFASSPTSPDALTLYGDALWASGLFDQAESEYHDALTSAPESPRGLHGLARSLAARGQLAQALVEAQHAVRLAPRDLEIHHTIGSIYEQMHKFEEAAAAYANYVNLLPNKDTSNKANWSRAEIRFLRSFGQRVPFETDPGAEDGLHSIPFRMVNDKVVVRARVNGALAQDFVVDTGSESTVVTRPTAVRLGILPITQTLSAGVGDVGLRGLQLGRIDTLELGDFRLRNVPCLIKNPPLRDVPIRETESLSPLALGYSMTIDYKTQVITFGHHLPQEPMDVEMPLRLYRLATVQGVVDGSHHVNFIVDTGGEVISISAATASALGRDVSRRIGLRVFGTSGWDRDAFLLPGVNLAFDNIKYNNYSVVVLNLDTPSALLGFQVGGIVGHNFLRHYRVAIDLERSTLGLTKVS